MKRVLFFTLCIIICMYAASIEDGINWLKNKQNPDGSWGNPDRLGFIETVEVLNTFIVLGETTGVENGLNYLENQFPENTDFAARKLSLLARTEREFYYLLQQLLSWENTDGGFGFLQHYQSSIWETVLSIKALKDAGLELTETLPPLHFILNNQNTDGGFGFFLEDTSHTLATAYCAYILSNFKAVDGVDLAINRSVEWLYQRQNPDSGFGDDGSTIYETAVTYFAFRCLDVYSDKRNEALGYISVRQDANGSWDNDIYLTALALRAVIEGNKPNLRITPEFITFYPEIIYQGDTVIVSAEIQNNGDYSADSVLVQFMDDFTLIDSVVVTEIPAQGNEIAQVNWFTAGLSDTHNITVNIDPHNTIIELDEDDNIASKKAYVIDTLLPDTLKIWVHNEYFSPNGDFVKDYSRVYFKTSEEVAVDVTVKDNNQNIVKLLIQGEWYQAGTHSTVWDGSDTVGITAKDDEYMYEVIFTDPGNNKRTYYAFVCVDNNKNTIFDGLSPYYLDKKEINPLEDWIEDFSYNSRLERIAYIYTGLYPTWQYYLIVSDAFGKEVDTIFQSSQDLRGLQWRPNTRKIAVGERTWAGYRVWEVDAVTHEKKVVVSDSSCYHYCYSPLGNKIAYLNYYDSLFTIDANGTNLKFIASDVQRFEWAPNDRWLGFVANDTIYRVGHSGQNIEVITPVVYYDYFSFFRWSPDAARIVFNSSYDIYMSDSLWFINSDGSNLTLLFATEEYEMLYGVKWSKDNNRLLISIGTAPAFGKGRSSQGSGYFKKAKVNSYIKAIKENRIRGNKERQEQPELYLYDIAAKKAHFLDSMWIENLMWSKDEDWVLFTGEGNFWGIRLKDTTRVKICEDIYLWGRVTYSLDETRFYLYSTLLYNMLNLTGEITTLTREPETPKMLTIRGITCDRNLDKYQLEYGYGLYPNIYYPIVEGNEIILDSIITRWTPPQPGHYELRLTVFDKAGNSVIDEKTFEWDENAVLTDLKAEPRFISPNSDTINDTTVISYTLLDPQPLIFKIYDLKNNLIREFYKDDTLPGEYSFVWNGKDATGDTVSDGRYKLTVDGMIITIVVDKMKPYAGCGALHMYGPSIAVLGTAIDTNFYQFTLDYSPTGKEEDWYTIFIGDHPKGGVDSLAEILSLDPLVLLGDNYFKLLVEDRAGNKRTAYAGKYVDSVEIFPEIVFRFNEPHFRVPYQGMAAFPAIDSANFITEDTVSGEYRNLGLAEPIPGKPKMYEKLLSGDSLFDGVNKIKFQAFRSGIETKYDSVLLIKVTPTPYSFDIIAPFNNDTVSGNVPVTAKAVGINIHLAKFYYVDESMGHCYIGSDTISPFDVDWDTYFLEDGFYTLYARGIDDRGILHNTDPVEVYVENSRPTVILYCDTYLSGIEELHVDAWPSPLHQQWGAYIENVRFEIKTETSWQIFAEDSTQPYLAFLTTTDYDDGPCLLRVSAWDNYEDTGYVYKDVIVDNTKPEAEITSPIAYEEFVNIDSISVIGTAHDEHIDFYKLDYASDSIWGNITEKNQSVQNDLLGIWHTDILDSALYNLRLLVRDKAENESTYVVPVYIYNTNPAPIVYISYPTENAYLKDTVDIQGTVQDDDLVFWTLSYKSIEPPGNWFLLDSGSTNIQGVIHAWNTLTVPDGKYSLRLRAGDGLSEKDFYVNVTIDNTAPIVEITSPQNNDFIAHPFYVEGTATDTNFAEYKIEAGEGEYPGEWIELFTSSSPVVNDTLAFIDPLPGTGLYSLKLSATDLAENFAEAFVLINIDTLPPTPPQGLAVAESLPYQINLTWELNTEPDLAGYNIYEKGLQVNTELTPFPYFTDTVPGDGYYSYQVTAVDLGNLESDFSDSATITIDHTPPVLAISSPSDSQRIGGLVEIIGTVTDPHLREYILEAAPDIPPIVWEELTRGYVEVPNGKLYDWNIASIDSGFYLLKLKGKDTYNNIDSIIISVYIDNLPPNPPSNLVAIASYDTVTTTWLKNLEPDLAGYVLFRDDVPINTDSLITDTTYTEILPDGIYTYYVIAVDSAGNRSLPSNSDSVEIDTRPPHAIIISPEHNDSVAGIVQIVAEVEDNDIKEVLFQYRGQAAWQDIGIDTLAPFSVLWNTEGLPFGQYFLKAIATDIHNNTDPAPDSITVFLVADLDPPAVPRGLAVDVAYDTVDLTWWQNTEPDLAGYNVYRNNEKINTALVLDTTYSDYVWWNDYVYYQVSAVDTAANESAKTDSVKADLLPPEVSISYPQWYEIYAGIVPIIGTAWDEALVEYSLAYGIGWDPVEFIPISSCSTSKINDTLGVWNTYGLEDDLYTIQLKAFDLYTNRDSTRITIEIDNTPPNPPFLSGELLPDTTVLLSWKPDTWDYEFFNVYRSLTSGTNYTKIAEVQWDTSYIDTAIELNKTYYYVVTAVDRVGNESEYSNEVEIQMPISDIDLTISSDDIDIYPPSPVEGNTALIRAEIHNLGSATAYDIEVEFTLKFEGNYITIGDIQNIDSIPGQDSRYAFVYWHTQGYAGSDTIIVVVDPQDYIIETDENNNWAKKDVLVRTTALSFDIQLDKESYDSNTDVNILLSLANTGSTELNINITLQIFDSLSNVVSGPKEITGFYWVDDTVPQGAQTQGNWIWDTTFFYYGEKCHSDTFVSGIGEHRFFDATDTLEITTDQSIVQYVYISPEHSCQEIMLEFITADGSREHRAYWGENLIERGIDNTDSRRKMGFLPANGKWIRLDVPAETVGIENKKIIGISYLVYTGKVYWDRTCLGLKTFDYAIAPSESTTLSFAWNTRVNPAGNYYLETEIFDGDTTYEMVNNFSINQIGELYSEITTDKLEYDPNETVTMNSIVINQSANYTYENLTEKVCITNAVLDTLYQGDKMIEVLPPGESSNGQYYFNTLDHLPGEYVVWEIVLDQEENVISSDSTTFYIRPSQGGNIVLIGEIDIVPVEIPYPDSFDILYSITNKGNLTADSIPIMLRIIESQTQNLMYTYNDTITLLVNETFYDTLNLSSAGYPLSTYMCILSAVLPDTEIVITYGGFRVIDIYPPTIISISPTGIVGSTITIQSQIFDDVSGVDSAFYKIVGDYEVLTRISGDSLLGIYAADFNTTTLADGDYFLNVKARDKKNNEAIDSVGITIDNTPPEISITGVVDSTFYNVDVTPVIIVTDLNLDSVCILLNNNPFESGTIVTDDGEYTLYVYARDLAGNDADTSIFFIVDKTPPEITISGIADSTWYNHTVTLFITFTDPHLDSTSILLNGEPFESGEPVEPEGEYTLYAWAIDRATNTTDTSIYFVIDKTPPDPPIMVSPPESTTVAYSPITIEGLSEPYSSVILDIEGTFYDTVANNLSQFTLENVSLNPGWNLLKFTAKDKANNVSDTSYYHLNLGVGIELEASIYIPQKFARILVFAKDDSNFVKSVLDSIEVFYTLVNNRQDFEDEFHSGIYNLYLIAGENCELHPHIQDEIVEMVNIGDGLVVTTRGTQHMHRFEEVFSVKFKGHIPANKIESIMFHESPISHPDTLSISAKVVKFEVHNSTLAAEFNTGNPAAVTNEYGNGRAVFFGFDMTDIIPSPLMGEGKGEGDIKQYLVNAITYTTPDTSGVYPGATIPVEISIKNLSPEQRLNVVEVVPENFIIIAALDSGIISGPTITWNFPILQDSTVYLNSIIKLPNQEFTDTISVEISYLSEGNYVPYDTLYLEISTISRRITPSPSMGEGKGEGVKSYPLTPERLIDKIIKEFNSISYEHMPRDSIYEVLHRLKEAKNLLNLKSKAIEHLLYVAQRIKHIPEFADMRKKIDLIIKRVYSTSTKGEK